MKKIGIWAVAAVSVLASGAASAADLPAAQTYKAPAVVAPVLYNWTGLYVGANGGYGWSSQCIDITAVNGAPNYFSEGCKSVGGGALGGQIGYRWQSGPVVFGVEAMGDWANIRGSRVSLFNGANTWKSTIDGFGLFTGSIGYAWNNVLLYAKGGAAVANQRFDSFNTFSGIGVVGTDQAKWGGTVGAGLEYGFAPNWTAGIEYDYLWRVSNSNLYLTPALAPIGVTSIGANTKSDLSLLTVHVSYKFGGL
jgi:outer membrane immunogenic protein